MGKIVYLRAWLAEEREHSLKLVSAPRHVDGVPLTVHWLPRSVVVAEFRWEPARPGDWPAVEVAVPRWYCRRNPGLERCPR